MLLESCGEWDSAVAEYDAILAKAPSHEGAHKRKIAVLRCAAASLRASCLR